MSPGTCIENLYFFYLLVRIRHGGVPGAHSSRPGCAIHIAAKTSRAALIVAAMSASLCAADTKPASKADGAR